MPIWKVKNWGNALGEKLSAAEGAPITLEPASLLEATLVRVLSERGPMHLWQLEAYHPSGRALVEPALYRLRKKGTLVYSRKGQWWSLR